MTIDEMIAVLQASKDGKKIQARRYGTIIWDTPPLEWSFADFEYRVKPEQMEIEVWVHPSHPPFVADNTQYMHPWTKKKFREVIE